jgi:hypothetical protein
MSFAAIAKWGEQFAGEYDSLVSQYDKFITNNSDSWGVAVGDLFSSHPFQALNIRDFFPPQYRATWCW